jgi:subfamily B ATP-binding cassette protein MsbA
MYNHAMNKKQSKGLETYRRLLKATQKYWLCFLLGVLGTAAMSLVDAGFAWLIKPIIDKGFINRDPKFIHWLPVMVIFIFIFRSFFVFLSNYCVTRVSRQVVRDFRRRLFEHMQKLPVKFYDKSSSGQLISTLIYNVEQVAQASSTALLTILQEATLVVGLVMVIVSVSWELFLLFLIIIPFIAWILKSNGSRLKRISSSVQKSVGEVTRVAAEGISAQQVVRLYGGQQYERQKFYEATKANQERELKIAVVNSMGTSVVQLLLSIFIAVVLVFATLPSLHISAGAFGTIISSVIMLLRPMRRLTTVHSLIQKGVAGAESIFAVLDEETEKDAGNRTIARVRGEVVFSHVHFGYEQGKAWVLSDINFAVKPGKTIAIVGRSGAGKSTLINLLPRFYELQSGVISIDGIDVRDFQLSNLRQQFALVSQQSILFNDTIAHNIAYGQQEGVVSRKQIEEAAKAAYAWEFIHEFPQGLDTIIGENGVLLSGGQRQRIAIARALLKNAPILILDEATSSLDTHSERQIQAALDNLMHRSTTFVIAHRLSTIENADWIIVMEQGQIVEQGPHLELLAKNGAYATLYQLQFKEILASGAELQPSIETN